MIKKLLLVLLTLISGRLVYAQHQFTTIVKSEPDQKFLKGVTVTVSTFGQAITDAQGRAQIGNISSGAFAVTWSHVGFITKTDTIRFPLENGQPIEVYLEPEEEAMEEVIVQSTRTSRTISNTPTRVEIIDGEELEEKNNMRPANVSMLLHESTGIQVQQTSATSGNASLRIQGLDGRYTQLLKDGYANFGNFASGLSILEIPPLDLKQVEVIKGPASTLYGGGAIAGVVNFISRTPDEKFEGDIMLNQSNIGQSNIGGYFSGRGQKMGYAVLGLLNLQKAYDVDGDDFSDLPRNNNFTINPRLFFYPDETTLITIGNSLTVSKNTGGDMHVISGDDRDGHVYYEKNETFRNTSTLELSKQFLNKSNFRLKQSVTIFNRDLTMPGYQFMGKNINSFTDMSYLRYLANHTMIGGANFIYDQFEQEMSAMFDNRSATAGLYFQDTWDLSELVKLETGLRVDHVNYRNNNFKKAQTFALPRVSALFKWSGQLSSRIGGGYGYKTPTLFTERTEGMQYRNIAALENVTAEKSVGGTADISYRTNIGGAFSLSLNQMFFMTHINKPLVLEQISETSFSFVNAGQPVVTQGFETNLRFIFKEDLKLFLGYTFTDARATYLQQNQVLPLMPKHKLNTVLMYEKEDNFKLGLEGYHTGTQYLYNGTKTPSFWEFGFMAQKTFGRFSLFVNFENFTDERQSNYKPVVSGPLQAPAFDDIWNHMEGRVVNGGVKIKI
ncbi:TonB-dependent receptor [Niabella insulamsoli]|uniref:TonB-dependent receptor n=1 Tax=Niabella insulamsoli TaxID=3144874 RepID=UPI0031FCB36F